MCNRNSAMTGVARDARQESNAFSYLTPTASFCDLQDDNRPPAFAGTVRCAPEHRGNGAEAAGRLALARWTARCLRIGDPNSLTPGL